MRAHKKQFLCLLFIVCFGVELSTSVKIDLAYRWSGRALKRCKELTTGKNLRKNVCSTLESVIQESFDEKGVSLMNIVESSTHNDLVERAEEEPFSSIGNINRIIYWMIEENIYKEEDIKREWDMEFIGWMLKLVANDRSGLQVSKYKPGYEYDPDNPTTPKKRPKPKKTEL